MNSPLLGFTIWRENCGLLADLDLLWLELLVIFPYAGEVERPGVGGRSLGDACDDVGTAEPMGFRQVGGRPMCWMVRVGVVEAENFLSGGAGCALYSDQVQRGYLIEVVRVSGVCVFDRHSLRNQFSVLE